MNYDQRPYIVKFIIHRKTIQISNLTISEFSHQKEKARVES